MIARIGKLHMNLITPSVKEENLQQYTRKTKHTYLSNYKINMRNEQDICWKKLLYQQALDFMYYSFAGWPEKKLSILWLLSLYAISRES